MAVLALGVFHCGAQNSTRPEGTADIDWLPAPIASEAYDPNRAFGNIDRNFKNDVAASAPKSEDEIMFLRRKFLYLFAGVTTMPLSSIAQAQVSPSPHQSVQVATGLLATWQSTAWLGAEAGVFKKRGIDMTLPAIAVGGPEAAAGLVRGDWEFAHTGTVPVAEEVLKGRDIVILATPTSDFPKSFVMTRKEITRLVQLDGKKVGVLTESGQTSVATRITGEKAGATATYLPLIKFDRIYAALAAGEIDAGALPIDLRFSGHVRYGWNAFPIDAFDTPSIFATTRKLIVSNRQLVMNVMQGFVETIHSFKTRPDIVVPLLQRYIKIEDRKVAEDLYAFHVPVFQKVPRPSFPGLQELREFLVAKYPTAMSLKESDIADSSFIDELERSGFIDRLYAPDTK
jgi:ABC-type nitrate/sulfonate/bicarbonate transport system substrate-binding protein